MSVIHAPAEGIRRISPQLNATLHELVAEAGPTVERVLGDWGGRVAVEWDAVDVDGEQVARVRLTDADVTQSADFTEAELTDERHTRWRLYRLWADVLDVHLRRHRTAYWDELAATGG